METLKQLRQWVCWKKEKNQKGKVTKVPCSASGGVTGADEPHRGTWGTYTEAKAAAEKNHFDGTGFVIPEGYFMLDVDEREVSDPLVQELLRWCNTYAEISVGGHGVHFVGKCDLSRIPTQTDKNGVRKLSGEFYTKNPRNKLELYIGGLTTRYATFSGKVIQDLPIADCTDALLRFLDKHMRRKPEPSQPTLTELPTAPAEELSAEEFEEAKFDIICALRKQKNGDKFSRLFDQGDIIGYTSHSEADQALCNLIAFRAGNWPEMIDAIFRDSALYRDDKWGDREDYREVTIAKAIEACEGGFAGSPRPRPPFVRSTSKGGQTVVPPLLAKYIRETERILLVQNDTKQGTQTYVYENGCYRYYSKDMMLGLIKEPVEAYDETLVTMPKMNEVYNLLITDRKRIPLDQLNANEHLINFQNGLLEVTPYSLKLLPHSPDVYSTIQIPCDWTGEEISTPVFDSYLHTLVNGDKDVIRLMLQIIGVVLSNVKCWRMKKTLFLEGDGDTGKSVLKALVERMLGPGNFVAIDLQTMEERFGTGMIYNTRLAGCADMSFMKISELKTLKQITGGDSIFAEFKGQQGFKFTYNGFLWFCMNKKPKFGGDDGKWVYDRIMLVKCPNIIPKDQQDKELPDKLYAEREGILYKAVKALQTVLANGYRFSEPESVLAARTGYQTENNSVLSFFEECMCKRKTNDKSEDCTITDAYDAYREWCRDNNNGYVKTKREFKEKLAERLGCSVENLLVHKERGWCFPTVTLKKEYREPQSIFAA